MRGDRNYPLISIIIPVYNTELYLGICLQSVLNQTYPNLEIIVVNDGSTDKCPDICNIFASSDPRIRVFHQLNQGVNNARNIGLNIARGEFIAFVDSDDWLEPNMYLSLYEAMEQCHADIAVCPHYRERNGMFDLSCKVDRITEYNKRKALLELYKNRTIRNCLYDKLFQRHLFDEIVFPDDYHHEDVEVLCLLLYRAARLVVYPQPMYHYRMHPESISHRQNELEREYHTFRALDNQYRFLYDNDFLIKRQPTFVSQGLRLLDRLSKASNLPRKEEIFDDIVQRLRFYWKAPIRELGIMNSLFLFLTMNYLKGSRKKQVV